MRDVMGALLAGAIGVPLVLAAAKLHGRQVRLEREQAGYHSVAFGADNPPFVEALWRRDRLRFWTLAPLLAAIGAALAWRAPALALVAALLWAPALAFVACVAWSGARAGWPQARGTLGWGLLVVALATGSATAAAW